MKAYITKHQFNQIVNYIALHYQTFATQSRDGKVIFDEFEKQHDIPIKTPKTVIPFKKILWPNPLYLDNYSSSESEKLHNSSRRDSDNKIAFIGLTNCDAIALNRFLKEFSHTSLLPKRETILVVSSECQSDEFCFCTAFGNNKIESFDLHIQKEKDGFSIFAGTHQGELILKENGVKLSKSPKIREIKLEDRKKLNPKDLNAAINDRKSSADFWQKTANNCFGCGACSAVCPLCFCTKQEADNFNSKGSCSNCLKWDSCFAKNFSEIQNHYDFRPQNVDRLYNWYHHKFVRAHEQHNHFLCTGCGRCIEACPAHLNQYRIIKSLENKED